jgi:hypothetical protein
MHATSAYVFPPAPATQQEYSAQEPVESTIELIDLFGVEQDRVEEINWALKYALQRCSA